MPCARKQESARRLRRRDRWTQSLIDGVLIVHIWGDLNIKETAKKSDQHCCGRQVVGATTGEGPKETATV